MPAAAMEWNKADIQRGKETILRHSKRIKNGCRLWIAFISQGYGAVGFCNKTTTAHRLSYQLHMGLSELDSVLQVRHLCGNSLCVEPSHLTTGTAVENAADKIAHGTSPHGKNTKISVDVARLVKYSKGQGTAEDRAKHFSVPVSIVRAIDGGTSWVWLGKTQEEDDKNKKPKRTTTKRKSEPFSDEDFKRTRTYIFQRVTNAHSMALCAIWKLRVDKGGYGKTTCAPFGYQSAHRLSYMAFNNTNIPVGQVVRHMCIQNRACCNPMHLAIGTVQDNVDDTNWQNTRSRGETHHWATISANTAQEILNSRGEGTHKERAVRFDTAAHVVKAIDNKKAWTHLRHMSPLDMLIKMG